MSTERGVRCARSCKIISIIKLKFIKYEKILLSISMITVVAVVAIGATGVLLRHRDPTGNTFTAGAIDLGVDNTSHYNSS